MKGSLAIQLSKLKNLKDFNLRFEQYPTPSELAAEAIYQGYLKGFIKNKTIADLGAGNGILGIASLILNAKYVYFIEKDIHYKEILKQNLKEFNNYEIRIQDLFDFNKQINTIVMNPPFGLQSKISDLEYLRKAMKISENIISIHHYSDLDLFKRIAKESNFKIIDHFYYDFLIKKQFKFHKKNKKYFKAMIIYLTHS